MSGPATASWPPGWRSASPPLHHLDDTPAALHRLGSLLVPGGTLAVVTFVGPSLRDFPWQATAWIRRGITLRLRGNWQHSAPVIWPPRDTLRQLKQHARTRLPGSRVQRLAYGRVLITWTSPGLARGSSRRRPPHRAGDAR